MSGAYNWSLQFGRIGSTQSIGSYCTHYGSFSNFQLMVV
jgi:hypothetical protein